MKTSTAFAIVAASVAVGCHRAPSGETSATSSSIESSGAASTTPSAATMKKSPAVDETFVTITNSSTGVRDAIGSKKGKYIRSGFEVTINKAVPKGYTILERFACDVDGKRIVEESSALVDLSKLSPGETTKAEIAAWPLDPLSSSPTRCEIVLSLGQLIGGWSVELGAACTNFVTAKSSPGRCT